MRQPAAQILAAVAVLASPLSTFAAGKSFKELVDGPITTLGNQIIYLLYTLAFIAFLIGMVRFFFSHDSEARQKGKMFAIYSIVGLAVLFAVWGVVRVLLGILTSAST